MAKRIFGSLSILGAFFILVSLPSGKVVTGRTQGHLAPPSSARRDKLSVLELINVTVIDMTGSPPKPHEDVVITGDRITRIGDSKNIRAPRGAREVNATGDFLIPGLWDMHVHWYDKRYLPLFIANGVTGIRVMFGFPMHHEWRKEIEAGQLLGPRMVIASPIIDGPKPLWPMSVSVHNGDEARQAVIDAKKYHADFVKVYSFLPRDAYFAIADESKKLGIPFEGHVPWSVSAEEASDAGQKSFEHLFGILTSCSSREEEIEKAERANVAVEMQSGIRAYMSLNFRPLLQEILDTYSAGKASSLFALFKRNGTWQCPTFTVLRTWVKDFSEDPSFAHDRVWLKYMPRSLRDQWDIVVASRQKPSSMLFMKKRGFQKRLEVVGAMQKAGVGILAGTDTLNPYCFPGFSLHDELSFLVQAGLTPMQALQAATLNPARFLGREKDMGTVEVGKLADLVLLDANPLDDINNANKIAAVVYRGRFYSRAALNGMLAKVRTLANKRPIAPALMSTIKEKGVDSAVKQYHKLRATQPGVYDFGEGELDGLGFQLLSQKRVKDAIRILALNVEAYPHSSDTYGGLAEAYMADGDKELAIKDCREALQLNPENFIAARDLKKLGVK